MQILVTHPTPSTSLVQLVGETAAEISATNGPLGFEGTLDVATTAEVTAADVVAVAAAATAAAVADAALAVGFLVRHAAGVPTGAPAGQELPVAFDSTAVSGGLYFWDGAAWVKASAIP